MEQVCDKDQVGKVWIRRAEERAGGMLVLFMLALCE